MQCLPKNREITVLSVEIDSSDNEEDNSNSILEITDINILEKKNNNNNNITMESKANLSDEAHEAMKSAELSDLKKKINAASWNDQMEGLIKSWGEKAAGLRYMHNVSAGTWKDFGNKLTLWSIGITTIASGMSLVSASIDDEETKNIVLYVVGGVGIVSGFLQTLKKFYNAEEKAADHASIAKQFGSFYRYVTLQLGMPRSDRLPSDKLSEWTLKEYERLQLDAPPVGGDAIKSFKTKFTDPEQSVPDICEEKFVIKVYND